MVRPTQSPAAILELARDGFGLAWTDCFNRTVIAAAEVTLRDAAIDDAARLVLDGRDGRRADMPGPSIQIAATPAARR
ncbi:hypothetical protein ACVWXL_000220 [Bradyrhizobium sp. GM22.5]